MGCSCGRRLARPISQSNLLRPKTISSKAFVLSRSGRLPISRRKGEEGERYPLNQLKVNQNEPKQNQPCDHLKDEDKENGYVKNGSFRHCPSIKQFLCLWLSKPPFLSIQISSFETPILIRKDLKRKRFSKTFLIISLRIWIRPFTFIDFRSKSGMRRRRFRFCPFRKKPLREPNENVLNQRGCVS